MTMDRALSGGSSHCMHSALMLREKFGAPYEAYEAQTGRLLPRLWGRRSPPSTS